MKDYPAMFEYIYANNGGKKMAVVGMSYASELLLFLSGENPALV